MDRANWLVPKQEIPEEVTVKIRYAHPGALATLEPLGRPPRPGQASLSSTRGYTRPSGRFLRR